MKRTLITPKNQILSKKLEAVVVYKCLGLQNKEIARVMFITEGTVRSHLSHVYEKFNIVSGIQLIHWYMENFKQVNLKNLLVS